MITRKSSRHFVILGVYVDEPCLPMIVGLSEDPPTVERANKRESLLKNQSDPIYGMKANLCRDNIYLTGGHVRIRCVFPFASYP